MCILSSTYLRSSIESACIGRNLELSMLKELKILQVVPIQVSFAHG
jgi:hypothetical protein